MHGTPAVGGGSLVLASDDKECAISWIGKPLPAGTLDVNVWRRGNAGEAHYAFVIGCDPGSPLATGIRFVCHRDHVEAHTLSPVGEPLGLAVMAEFPPTRWPEQWRFVVANTRIDCYRFGDRLVTVKAPKAHSGGIAVTTKGTILELRGVHHRRLDTSPSADPE